MNSGFTFCVVCGNTQGFPTFEGEEPSATTCDTCKEPDEPEEKE